MERQSVVAWAVPAALFGGAACVACAVSLVLAVLTAGGVTSVAFLGLPPLAFAALALALVAAALVAARILARREAACAVPPPRHPYLRFSFANAALGLVLAAATVVGVALVAKLVVEGVFAIGYVIHWTTTVPALVGAFAWIFHGELNRVRG